MHLHDAARAPVFARLEEERNAKSPPTPGGVSVLESLDPQTAAALHLRQAVASDSVPDFALPDLDGPACKFACLGTETLPLTGTRTVKFRQTVAGIPVYGSLVTVELGAANALVSLNAALGQPRGVDAVARIAPADAGAAVAALPGRGADLTGVVPRLAFHYDPAAAAWRLVYLLENVSVGPAPPGRKTFFVDAHSGEVVAEVWQTPATARAVVSAADETGASRSFAVEADGAVKLLQDAALNVQTFDFKLKDIDLQQASLPGSLLRNPPGWSAAAVSAHANASAVSDFLRNVVKRDNIDNHGSPLTSSINCLRAAERPPGSPARQWLNAFWDGTQMVYGQRILADGTTLSMAVDLGVVAHEMFHGVTAETARLAYAFQPGALNESYSDIFGVIIANFTNPTITSWSWEVGPGLGDGGKALRDISDPARLGQPATMADFRVLPNTHDGDSGGVHLNSGIHNHAAFLVMTSVDVAGKPLFTPSQAAGVFYLALTQQLAATSQFADSRRALVTSVRSLLRDLPAADLAARGDTVGKAFDAVGIAG